MIFLQWLFCLVGLVALVAGACALMSGSPGLLIIGAILTAGGAAILWVFKPDAEDDGEDEE